MIDFVYFDLGNILLSFDPALACAGLAKLVGTSSENARIALYDSGLEVQYEHGHVSTHEFAEQLRANLQVHESQISDDAIVESVSDMFTAVETMNGVLHSVRRMGLPVGLLSNTCAGHWEWIEKQRFPVMDFTFDAQILSFEIGSMKPDREIYQAAEAAADVPVSRILFLDDRLENVKAARSFDWQAEQCLGGPQAIDVLRKYKVTDLAN